MQIVDNIKQGTQEWMNLRAGKFTGSEIHKLLGVKGFGQTGETYIYEVAASQLTGICNDEISSFAMQRGKEYEEVARTTFEYKYSVEIKQAAAFIPEWSNECMISPDGYFRIEDKGHFGNEFKCPLLQGNHLQYCLIKNATDLKNTEPKYYWQVQMALMISDFELWMFSSFHPNFPVQKILHTAKIERNEKDILFLKERISQAIEQKNNILSKL